MPQVSPGLLNSQGFCHLIYCQRASYLYKHKESELLQDFEKKKHKNLFISHLLVLLKEKSTASHGVRRALPPQPRAQEPPSGRVSALLRLRPYLHGASGQPDPEARPGCSPLDGGTAGHDPASPTPTQGLIPLDPRQRTFPVHRTVSGLPSRGLAQGERDPELRALPARV